MSLDPSSSSASQSIAVPHPGSNHPTGVEHLGQQQDHHNTKNSSSNSCASPNLNPGSLTVEHASSGTISATPIPTTTTPAAIPAPTFMGSPTPVFGSPLSLTATDWQGRFYPGGSPGGALGPIAMPSFKCPRLARTSSNSGVVPNTSGNANANGVHAGAGTGANAITIASKLVDVFGYDGFDGASGSLDGVGSAPSSLPERDLCRNYTCCGVALPDLHALVDHFEVAHVEVVPPYHLRGEFDYDKEYRDYERELREYEKDGPWRSSAWNADVYEAAWNGAESTSNSSPESSNCDSPPTTDAQIQIHIQNVPSVPPNSPIGSSLNGSGTAAGVAAGTESTNASVSEHFSNVLEAFEMDLSSASEGSPPLSASEPSPASSPSEPSSPATPSPVYALPSTNTGASASTSTVTTTRGNSSTIVHGKSHTSGASAFGNVRVAGVPSSGPGAQWSSYSSLAGANGAIEIGSSGTQGKAQARAQASSGMTGNGNAEEGKHDAAGVAHEQTNGSSAGGSDTNTTSVNARSVGESTIDDLGFGAGQFAFGNDGFDSSTGSGFNSGTESSTLSGALGAGGSASGTPRTSASAFTPGGPGGVHMSTFTPPRAFNRYAGYANYSSGLPGTDPSPAYEHLESDARFGEAYNLDVDACEYGFEEKFGDEGYGAKFEEKYGDEGYESMAFGVAQKQKGMDAKIDIEMDLAMDLDLDMDMDMDMDLDMAMDGDGDVDAMRGIYGSNSAFGVRSMSGLRSVRGLETYGAMHGSMRGMRGLNGMHPMRGLHGIHAMRNVHGIRGVHTIHGPRGLNRTGMHAHGAVGGMGNNHLAATRCIPPALLTQSAAPSPLTTPLQTPFGTPLHTPGTTPASSRAGSPERETESHAHAQTTGAGQARAQARSKGHAAVRGGGATLALHPNSSKGTTNSARSRGPASQASASSRTAGPSAARQTAQAQAAAAARSAAAEQVAAGGIATHPSKTPTPSKPFPCPLPLCTKSYKQQNGLKYHLAHGACCYAPRDPAVEALSEGERERVERPWVCAVGSEGLEGEEAKKGCGRRYKNMNGLRYHYTHTGTHGAIGLEMLTQGKHPLPESTVGRGKTQAHVHTLSRVGSQSSLRAQAAAAQSQAAQSQSQPQPQTQQQQGQQAQQVQPGQSQMQHASRSSTPSTAAASGSAGSGGGAPLRGYFPPQRQLAPPVLSALSSLSAHSSSLAGSMVAHPSSLSAPATPRMGATVTVPVPTPVSVGTSAQHSLAGQHQRKAAGGSAGAEGQQQQGLGQGLGLGQAQNALKIRALNHSPAPSPLSPFPSAPWFGDDI